MKAESLDILYRSIVSSLTEAINSNGCASLVVCGGRSPLPLYRKLSLAELDWTKVSIYLGDDRVVAKDHIDSNERLIRDHLFINKARSARLYPLLDPRITIEKIRLPFDIVLLGLGTDGHFASLFPNQSAHSDEFDISEKPDFIMSEKPQGNPSHKRVSMNLSMLLDTKRCILLVTNTNKRITVDRAFTDNKMPLHFLLNQKKTIIEFSDLIM